jgi:hypothetical protein
VAQALLNKKIGDEVEFEIHGARHRHKVESIEACKVLPAAPPTEETPPAEATASSQTQ